MKKRYKISIAIATYNGEKYLSDQLNSIYKQTRLPDEVVISDDYSEDNTISIANRFKRQVDLPVHIFFNPYKRGYSSNFYNASQHCSGDLIFFCDQDDVWLPEKLQKVEKGFCQDKEADLIIHDAQPVDSHLFPIGGSTVSETMISKGYYLDDFCHGCCIAVKGSFLEKIAPIPWKFYAHDNWINDLATAAGTKKNLNAVLLKFRRHSNTVTKEAIAPYKVPLRQKFFHLMMKVLLLKNLRNRAKTTRLLIAKHKLFLQTLKQLMASDNYDQEKMSAFAALNKQKIDFHQKRLEIISQRFPLNFNKGVKVYNTGVYNEENGLATLLNDLLAIS